MRGASSGFLGALVLLALLTVAPGVGTGLPGDHVSGSSPTTTSRMAASGPSLTCSGLLEASASASPATGSAPFATQFMGSACGGTPPYTYYWTFGDGTTSTAQDATDTYASAGVYSVSFEANDSVGDHAWSNLTVTVDPALRVTLSTTAGPIPLSVVFWANVSGTSEPASVEWQFGDGSSGSGAGGTPIQHTYADAGNYTAEATVTVQGSGWVGHASRTVEALKGSPTPPPLSLSIAPTPNEGSAPLPISITSSAAGGSAPYVLTLTFGDGTPSVVSSDWSGAAVTSAHTYVLPGEYTITATLTDSAGHAITSTAGVFVTGAPTLVASAITTKTSGGAPLTTTFVASVSGGSAPYALKWAFGDGTFGSGVVGVPLSHTYVSGGSYTAVLTVTDADGHTTVVSAPTILVSGGPSKSPSSTGLSGAGAWWTQYGTEVGGVGLIVVLFAVVLLEERRRHREAEVEARALIEAMESAKGSP